MRNLIKRAAREAFRQRGAALAGWDIVLRLHRKLAREQFEAASSPALKQLCRDELAQLLDAAVARVASSNATRPPVSSRHDNDTNGDGDTAG